MLTITCIGGVHDSFKKFIKRAFEMSTIPLDFHKIKLAKTMAIDTSFGTTCKSKFFYHCRKHFIHKNNMRRK
jgi:hypothetical protein